MSQAKSTKPFPEQISSKVGKLEKRTISKREACALADIVQMTRSLPRNSKEDHRWLTALTVRLVIVVEENDIDPSVQHPDLVAYEGMNSKRGVATICYHMIGLVKGGMVHNRGWFLMGLLMGMLFQRCTETADAIQGMKAIASKQLGAKKTRDTAAIKLKEVEAVVRQVRQENPDELYSWVTRVAARRAEREGIRNTRKKPYTAGYIYKKIPDPAK